MNRNGRAALGCNAGHLWSRRGRVSTFVGNRLGVQSQGTRSKLKDDGARSVGVVMKPPSPVSPGLIKAG